MSKGWIGVDLDGTLAVYDKWRGEQHIGLPIPNMVRRITQWETEGYEVRIFTARACAPEGKVIVEAWLLQHGFGPLMVTNEKDFSMVELWDDRCVQVVKNTGDPLVPQPGRAK